MQKLENLLAFSELGRCLDKEKYLENQFAILSVEDCLEILSRVNIGAVRPASIADLRNENTVSDGASTRKRLRKLGLDDEK